MSHAFFELTPFVTAPIPVPRSVFGNKEHLVHRFHILTVKFLSLDALGMTFHRSIMTCKVLKILGYPDGHLHPTSLAVLFLQIAGDLEESYVRTHMKV